MAGLGTTLAQLRRRRRKFEELLTDARGASAIGEPRPSRLQEVTAFGSNPGNLRMRVHVPRMLPNNPALVVALHGCTQSAEEYERGTGWSALADRHGFIVLYPEQLRSNNANTCFSWFLQDDIARDKGEARSIRQMVAQLRTRFGIDPRRRFVTGLSAGGAMAAVMLATYPEVFAGGAILAGLPYGCAASLEQAFAAMFTQRALGARALGDRVRAASRHPGPWPRISVWHGSADAIVKPCNGEDVIRQWTDLHGLPGGPTHEETIDGHVRRVWRDAEGKPVIEGFSIKGMAHGVPLGGGMKGKGCGAVGPFFLDVGISSTLHIARFWGVVNNGATTQETAPYAVPQSVPQSVPVSPLLAPAQASICAAALLERHRDASQGPARQSGERRHARPLDPKQVIAAAFRAAGLPLADVASELPLLPSGVDPGQLITAALKAAGLMGNDAAGKGEGEKGSK